MENLIKTFTSSNLISSYWIQGVSIITVPSLLRGAFIPSLSLKVANEKKIFFLTINDESQREMDTPQRKVLE